MAKKTTKLSLHLTNRALEDVNAIAIWSEKQFGKKVADGSRINGSAFSLGGVGTDALCGIGNSVAKIGAAIDDINVLRFASLGFA